MKTFTFGGDCACGERVGTKIKKPSALTPSFSKITCPKCQTKILVQAYVEKGVWPRNYKHDVEILHLSDVAKEAVKKRLLEKAGQGEAV